MRPELVSAFVGPTSAVTRARAFGAVLGAAPRASQALVAQVAASLRHSASPDYLCEGIETHRVSPIATTEKPMVGFSTRTAPRRRGEPG